MIMTLDIHPWGFKAPWWGRASEPNMPIVEIRCVILGSKSSQLPQRQRPRNCSAELTVGKSQRKKWIKDDESRKGCRDFKVPFTKNIYWSRFMSQHMASYKGSGRSRMSFLCLAGTVTNCERKDQQAQTHLRMLNTNNVSLQNTCCTYMLIWKNTTQIHNMSIHQCFFWQHCFLLM